MPYYSNGVIITGNVVSHVFSGTIAPSDGIGIDIDFGNTNCQIINNHIYECEGPGITMFSAATAGRSSDRRQHDSELRQEPRPATDA